MVDLINLVMSPQGGLFALGFGLGASGGWAFCQQTIVQMQEKKESECTKRLEEFSAKCALLEQRVRDLEQARFDLIFERLEKGDQ